GHEDWPAVGTTLYDCHSAFRGSCHDHAGYCTPRDGAAAAGGAPTVEAAGRLWIPECRPLPRFVCGGHAGSIGWAGCFVRGYQSGTHRRDGRSMAQTAGWLGHGDEFHTVHCGYVTGILSAFWRKLCHATWSCRAVPQYV